MKYTSQDIIIIEQALQTAMQIETNPSKIEGIREVLTKLRESAEVALQSDRDDLLEEEAYSSTRFDYDDSSDPI
ncbi:hypothetical protein NV379_02865 [Paenibacillus sp. N1-5-1-14]|uniref:hypothetical protein n=1 Tax=Paenibacillus radicibacter TaxID=2972488 RepID=UPI00215906FB|nr:hypothetical protein [Paenibacillus radicibacter]MCR8641589.1 hypothetical protein [Paenibacillus radicibacter]